MLLDLKLGLKTKQKPTPRIITDKGKIQDCRKRMGKDFDKVTKKMFFLPCFLVNF